MRLKSFLLALIVLLLQFVVLPGLFIYLNSLFNLPVFFNFILKTIGFVLIVIGFMLFSYCFGLFKLLGKGTPVPIEPPKELVVEGIYKYSRNPIFIAYILIWWGEFFVFGQLLLLFLAILLMLCLHLGAIFIEEKTLRKRFGESYINYCKKVPRWL